MKQEHGGCLSAAQTLLWVPEPHLKAPRGRLKHTSKSTFLKLNLWSSSPKWVPLQSALSRRMVWLSIPSACQASSFYPDATILFYWFSPKFIFLPPPEHFLNMNKLMHSHQYDLNLGTIPLLIFCSFPTWFGSTFSWIFQNAYLPPSLCASPQLHSPSYLPPSYSSLPMRFRFTPYFPWPLSIPVTLEFLPFFLAMVLSSTCQYLCRSLCILPFHPTSRQFLHTSCSTLSLKSLSCHYYQARIL